MERILHSDEQFSLGEKETHNIMAVPLHSISWVCYKMANKSRERTRGKGRDFQVYSAIQVISFR